MGLTEGDDLLSLSFFELDSLFSKSARALRRKKRKQREREGKRGQSASRSNSPARKKREGSGYGGFSGRVDSVEKSVVVTGVPSEADERLLFAHFSAFGTINDVKVVSNHHDVATGVVVIEFGQEEGVARASSLLPPYNEILGKTVQVKRADSMLPASAIAKAKQQRAAIEAPASVTLPLDPILAQAKKLHITNLRAVVTEDDMRGIFKPFGEIERIVMNKEECWITFATNSAARDAMGSMQNFQLVGQELRIALIGPDSGVPALAAADGVNISNDTDFGATKPGKNAASTAQNRLDLMQKLIDSRGQPFTPGLVPPVIISGDNGVPTLPPPARPGGPGTRTLLLQNMYTPAEVDLTKEPNFYDELREDTQEEVGKHGKVLHIVVDPRGGVGQIYVCYESSHMRDAAVTSLNGRWFEGKKITAMGIDDGIWQTLHSQCQRAAGVITQLPVVPVPGTK